MKFSLYIAGLAFIIVSCSTTRNFSSIMEDDIYYVPGKKSAGYPGSRKSYRT